MVIHGDLVNLHIDIDSLSEQLIPHTKQFLVLGVNTNVKFDEFLALIA